MGDLSEDAPDDTEGLDAAAAHVANLLSTEPFDSRFSFSDISYVMSELEIILIILVTDISYVVYFWKITSVWFRKQLERLVHTFSLA